MCVHLQCIRLCKPCFNLFRNRHIGCKLVFRDTFHRMLEIAEQESDIRLHHKMDTCGNESFYYLPILCLLIDFSKIKEKRISKMTFHVLSNARNCPLKFSKTLTVNTIGSPRHGYNWGTLLLKFLH